MIPEDRIDFVNGAVECFVQILIRQEIISSEKDIYVPVCTEENYIDFVTKFDKLLYRMREDDGTQQYGKFWEAINALWGAIFHFWFNAKNFKDPPQNTLKDEPILHAEYLRMQELLMENKERYYWQKQKKYFQSIQQNYNYRIIRPIISTSQYLIDALRKEGIIIHNNSNYPKFSRNSIGWHDLGISNNLNYFICD